MLSCSLSDSEGSEELWPCPKGGLWDSRSPQKAERPSCVSAQCHMCCLTQGGGPHWWLLEYFRNLQIEDLALGQFSQPLHPLCWGWVIHYSGRLPSVVGCSAAALASTLWMPVMFPNCDNQNHLQALPDAPGGTDHPMKNLYLECHVLCEHNKYSCSILFFKLLQRFSKICFK